MFYNREGDCMSNVDFSKEIKKLLLTFEQGYIKSNHSLRNLNNPPVTVKEAQIIEAVDLLTHKKENIISHVANYLLMGESILSVATNTLERKGYLKRVKGKVDKRTTYLELTALSNGVLHTQTDFHKQIILKAFKGLKKFDIQELDNPASKLLSGLINFLKPFQTTACNRDEMLRNDINSTPEMNVYSKLYKSFQLMSLLQEQLLEKFNTNLSISEYLLLKAIQDIKDNEEPATNNRLAERLSVNNSTISIALRVLEKKGMIIRDVNPNNRRSVNISLLPRASKILDDLANENIKMLSNYLQNLSRDKINLLDQLLSNVMLAIAY
jgi:MarR family transcriptional regulator, repressor for mepA